MRKIIQFSTFISVIWLSLSSFSFCHEIDENNLNNLIEKFILKNPSILEKSLTNFRKSESDKKFDKLENFFVQYKYYL